MNYPKEWKPIENKFDQKELIKPRDNLIASKNTFCLSDFYVIQKWIDYAKGIGDQTVKIFDERPIIFDKIYEIAKKRSILWELY